MKNLLRKVLLICLTLVLGLACFSGCGNSTVKIGIPNDGTNLSRAIKLLEGAGFIEVDPSAGYSPEMKDITKYNYNVEIVPTTANTLTNLLGDYGACVINGTFAEPYGLNPYKDGLQIEQQSGGAENPYVNIIVAKSSRKTDADLLKVVEAFQTDLVAKYMNLAYPMFSCCFEFEDFDTSSFGGDQAFVDYINNYKFGTKGDKRVVKLGVVGNSTDYWYAVQYILDQWESGIVLERTIFSAYNIPNEAVNSGEIDINSFQHKAYLANEVNANGYEIESIGDSIMSPLTLYSEKYDSVDAIKKAAGIKG